MLRIINLHKRYGRKIILDGLSLQIERGIVLIRGPNGSGKSTLLKIIAGIERPTSGTVEIDGKPPEYARKSISYLGHRTGLYMNMSVRENLRFFSHIYGDVSFEEYAHKLGLNEYMDYPLRKLSRGNLQKVGIVRALMKEADVYLLDEPATALDTKSRSILSKILEGFRTRILLIASHDDMGVKADAEVNL